MRMRRKKNLDARLEGCSRITNMLLDERRFGADEAADPAHLIDLSALFGSDAPIELEIGCGKGGFICELAARHPEKNFLAVEKYANVLVTACERAETEGLKNVWFLWGDAEYLPRFLPAGSISALYLNFSTPFPKKAYAVHRLTHRHFLSIYRRLLTPDAVLVQKTDDRRLFQFSLEELSFSGYLLEHVTLDLHADNDPENIVTEYEQKFVDQGLPIYRLIARPTHD